MHDIVQNGLEEYLGGHVRRDFQAHLDECADCRGQVLEFQRLSLCMNEFRVNEFSADDFPLEEAMQPPPGFYARLQSRIESERQPSLWSFLSWEGVFGRRVAFAALMTMAVVGGLLVSQDPMTDLGSSTPDAIFASHDFRVTHVADSDRDHMMATLASYHSPVTDGNGY